jgi:hypothetical protein
MAGNNSNDILMVDICRTGGRVSRVTKQYPLTGDLAGLRPTMLNSLGCQPVISVQQAGATGVLERINQASGTFASELLPSADGTNRAYPGPSSHVSVIATSLGAGPISTPFPLSRASYGANHTFGTDVWFTESGGGFQTLHSTGHVYTGFGAGQQPYWVLKLPPARQYNGVSAGRLENHFYDNYLLMPVVSYHCEPLSLGWNPVTSEYAWSTSGKPTTLITTNQIGGGGTGERWDLEIRWNEVRPCFLAAKTHDISAANLGDAVQNGAGLNRFYSYQLLDSQQVPDFGGTVFTPYTYAQGDFRDTLIAYTDSTNEPTAGWTMDFETLPAAGGAASLPTPQTNWQTGIGQPLTRNYDMCYRYPVPTLTASDQGSGTKVYLQFALTIPGGFSQSGFIEFVKDPLATQAAWNVTPRYYEMLFKFTHQTALP